MVRLRGQPSGRGYVRACCLDRRANWIEVLSLMEFIYNNSYQTTIKMILHKTSYDTRCRSLLH